MCKAMCMFAGFIEATREEVKIMKEKISAPAGGKSQRLSNLVSFILLNTVQETDSPLPVLYLAYQGWVAKLRGMGG
jgi:hypothetical protein